MRQHIVNTYFFYLRLTVPTLICVELALNKFLNSWVTLRFALQVRNKAVTLSTYSFFQRLKLSYSSDKHEIQFNRPKPTQLI